MSDVLARIFLFVMIFAVYAVIFAAVGFLAAVPVYFLWNWLMPDLFHLQEITFMQAWGISWFTSILFKSTPATESPNNV